MNIDYKNLSTEELLRNYEEISNLFLFTVCSHA